MGWMTREINKDGKERRQREGNVQWVKKKKKGRKKEKKKKGEKKENSKKKNPTEGWITEERKRGKQK